MMKLSWPMVVLMVAGIAGAVSLMIWGGESGAELATVIGGGVIGMLLPQPMSRK